MHIEPKKTTRLDLCNAYVSQDFPLVKMSFVKERMKFNWFMRCVFTRELNQPACCSCHIRSSLSVSSEPIHSMYRCSSLPVSSLVTVRSVSPYAHTFYRLCHCAVRSCQPAHRQPFFSYALYRHLPIEPQPAQLCTCAVHSFLSAHRSQFVRCADLHWSPPL